MDHQANFESIFCPICKTAAFIVIYPGNFPAELSQEFLTWVYRSSSDQTLFEQVGRCIGCGLVYLNPRLNLALIIDAYAEGEDRTFVEQDDMSIRTFAAALRQISRKNGLRLSGQTRVLDIGCAGGAFLRAARDLGLSAIGIEPSRRLSQYTRDKHGLDVRSGTLSDHPFPEASFDLVTLWDVIEYLPDPGAELRQIRGILKPHGLRVVNYPDFGSLPAKVLSRKWPFLLSVHLIYYTRQTIRRQLEQTGFKVKSIWLHWQTLELGYAIMRAARYFPFLKLLETAVYKIGLSRLPVRYWMGQTQVVVKPYVS